MLWLLLPCSIIVNLLHLPYKTFSPLVTMERLSWKVKKEVGAVVLETGGTIFGGYVRDSILHDHYAQLYYENATPKEEVDKRYNDPSFYPEYKDRTILPDDIDCYFPTYNHLKQFEAYLLQHKFCFKRLFTRTDASEYIPRLSKLKNMLSHIRYKISIVNPNKLSLIRMLMIQNIPASARGEVIDDISAMLDELASKLVDIPSVQVDALIAADPGIILSPPFGELDFECNGLVLTKQGLSLADDLKEKQTPNAFIADINKLAKVHAAILKKEARLVQGNLTDKYRVTKMKVKGWTISHDDFSSILKCLPEETDTPTCIICHSSCQTNCLKLNCCAARYHSQCLIEAATKGTAAMAITKTCIMCKRHVNNIKNDISILQTLQE